MEAKCLCGVPYFFLGCLSGGVQMRETKLVSEIHSSECGQRGPGYRCGWSCLLAGGHLLHAHLLCLVLPGLPLAGTVLWRGLCPGTPYVTSYVQGKTQMPPFPLLSVHPSLSFELSSLNLLLSDMVLFICYFCPGGRGPHLLLYYGISCAKKSTWHRVGCSNNLLRE